MLCSFTLFISQCFIGLESQSLGGEQEESNTSANNNKTIHDNVKTCFSHSVSFGGGIAGSGFKLKVLVSPGDCQTGNEAESIRSQQARCHLDFSESDL